MSEVLRPQSDLLPHYLSIDEATRIAGCGRWYIYKLISDGDVEAKKLGRRTLVVATSLLAHMENLPRAVINMSVPGGTPKPKRERLDDLPAK